MKKISFLGGALMLFGAYSVATSAENISGYGVGGEGCGKYIQSRRSSNPAFDYQIATWSYGYLSGYNVYGGRPQMNREVEAETILAYLDKYCRDAPLATTSLGLDELIKTYTRRP